MTIWMKLLSYAGGAAVPLALGGCGFAVSTTTLELRNTTERTVRVHYYYGGEQTTIADILEETGVEVTVDVPPGETINRSFACDDFQAIYIEEAKLELGLGLGPSTDTRVYRDGSDFGCGDSIRFTFTTNTLESDIDVSFAQSP